VLDKSEAGNELPYKQQHHVLAKFISAVHVPPFTAPRIVKRHISSTIGKLFWCPGDLSTTSQSSSVMVWIWEERGHSDK